MKCVPAGASADVLFWFMEQGEVFGPQPADELQLEYFVPLNDHVAALKTVKVGDLSPFGGRGGGGGGHPRDS